MYSPGSAYAYPQARDQAQSQQHGSPSIRATASSANYSYPFSQQQQPTAYRADAQQQQQWPTLQESEYQDPPAQVRSPQQYSAGTTRGGSPYQNGGSAAQPGSSDRHLMAQLSSLTLGAQKGGYQTPYDDPSSRGQAQQAGSQPAASGEGEVQIRNTTWNHASNEVKMTFRFKWIGSIEQLQRQMPGGTNQYIEREIHANAQSAIRDQIIRVRGDVVKEQHAPESIVTITEAKVVSHKNGLYHDIGIGMDHKVPKSSSYVDTESGNWFLYVIPAETRGTEVVDKIVYKTNKDTYGKLAALYGGINPNAMQADIVDPDPSHTRVLVRKKSKVVLGALETLDKIRAQRQYVQTNPGVRESDLQNYIDPMMEFKKGDRVELKEAVPGFVSISREFINGFQIQLEKKVMKHTIPVNLLEFSLRASNPSGEEIGSRIGTKSAGSNIAIPGDTIYEFGIDLQLTFVVRYES